MKSLRTSFIIFISLLLLVSSSGVFVMIHTCMGSKKTEITFSDEHKCCGKERKSKSSCRIESKCCTVDYQYHKLNVVSVVTNDNITPDIAVSELPLLDFHVFLVEKCFQFIRHSPPLIEKDIAVQFRQLLI